MMKWLVVAASALGVLAICALVWFVFPIIGFSDIRPFESPWLRLAIIVFILAAYLGVFAYKLYKGRAAAQAIEAALTESTEKEPDSDEPVLAEKMNDALLTLKKSRKTKGDFLYELPWYIIIGPPGSGKTTALLNSGLKFPLAAGGNKGPVMGVGGTRYCDWWFTEEAVLIDTAGRYTTQDSDTEADRRSWLSFLDLLKKNRPRQPINGVMVAISLEDLMTLSQAEIAAHAVAIRKRLIELNDRLQINFPVYALFTKADLVAGFMEFFGSFSEQRRRLVWGATFQTADKKENKIGEVEPEFDLLLARLSQELPDRLQEEADPVSRARLFGFPSQMSALKPVIVDFLNQIFEPTRYHTNVPLRGFYFTSGTQEGTPIDRVLGSIAGSFGLQGAAAAAYSGRAKSFFLSDLLSKVIFGEAGWVSTNQNAVRRAMLFRYGGYALIGLASLVVLGGWWVSYLANSKLINDTSLEVEQYKAVAEPVIRENPVADTDFTKTLDLLHKLKFLPAGYGFADRPTPVAGTFGLSQRERLQSSSTEAYRIALDRTFRSRLVLHLEKGIEQNQTNPSFVYEALKVYLMLGGGPNVKVDRNLVVSWMEDDWNKLFPGAANQQTRAELMDHLNAMLDLDPGTSTVVPLNDELVKASQGVLVRLSLAERAYAKIKSDARNEPVEDWIASNRGGSDVATVFETKDGSPLDSIRVPNLYTYNGFHKLLLGKLVDVAESLESERWVLGEAGKQSEVGQQYGRLGPDLLQLYDRDFISAWQTALEKLKLKSLAADKPNFTILQAASGPTSPIKMLIESISSETKLTEERNEPEKQAGDVVEEAAAAVKAEMQRKLESRLTGMAKIGLDIAKKSELRPGETQAITVPGANIEAQFRRYHELTEATDGKNKIDEVLDQLSGIYQSLVESANNPNAAPGAMQRIQQYVVYLRNNASRLEKPFSGMILAATEEFEGKITNDTIDELNGELSGTVTRRCQEITANRFPFSAKSKREVPLTEFAKLFSPNGIIDAFFNEKLAHLVDMSREKWAWKKNTRLGRELSQATLAQFQNASKIRDAFFSGGGSVPSVKLNVVAQTLSQEAASAEFEINGVKLESVHGIDQPKDFDWPGNTAGGTASVKLLPEALGSKSSVAFDGPWALFQLLNYGGLSQSGDKLSVRFVIGGREVSYQIKVGSLENPFALPALRNFNCPSGL
jgi:type VI secretion system protein ImpL